MNLGRKTGSKRPFDVCLHLPRKIPRYLPVCTNPDDRSKFVGFCKYLSHRSTIYIKNILRFVTEHQRKIVSALSYLGSSKRFGVQILFLNMEQRDVFWVVDALEENCLRAFQRALRNAANTLAFCSEPLFEFQVGLCAVARPPEVAGMQLRVLQGLSKVGFAGHAWKHDQGITHGF